jgi:hypothetical protein
MGQDQEVMPDSTLPIINIDEVGGLDHLMFMIDLMLDLNCDILSRGDSGSCFMARDYMPQDGDILVYVKDMEYSDSIYPYCFQKILCLNQNDILWTAIKAGEGEVVSDPGQVKKFAYLNQFSDEYERINRVYFSE